jgi:hypothetical protein
MSLVQYSLDGQLENEGKANKSQSHFPINYKILQIPITKFIAGTRMHFFFKERKNERDQIYK